MFVSVGNIYIAIQNNQDAIQLNQNTQNHLHQPEAALRIHQAEAILRSQAEAALRLAVSQAAAVAASTTATNNLNNNANNNCNTNSNQSNGEQTTHWIYTENLLQQQKNKTNLWFCFWNCVYTGNGNGTNGSGNDLNALRHHNGSFLPQTNNGKYPQFMYQGKCN